MTCDGFHAIDGLHIGLNAHRDRLVVRGEVHVDVWIPVHVRLDDWIKTVLTSEGVVLEPNGVAFTQLGRDPERILPDPTPLDLAAEWAGYLDSLPSAATSVIPEGLQFENLAEAFGAGLQPPKQLVEGLVVEGQVNWFSGHPGHGKTTVVMWIAAEHMRAGGHVIWLDWEGGLRETLLRLRALGVDDELAVERFHYANGPYLTADEDGLNKLKPAVSHWAGALVVLTRPPRRSASPGSTRTSRRRPRSGRRRSSCRCAGSAPRSR